MCCERLFAAMLTDTKLGLRAGQQISLAGWDVANSVCLSEKSQDLRRQVYVHVSAARLMPCLNADCFIACTSLSPSCRAYLDSRAGMQAMHLLHS